MKTPKIMHQKNRKVKQKLLSHRRKSTKNLKLSIN